MSPVRNLPPGYTVVHPNRDKAVCKTTKGTVVLILLVSVALMLIVTVGGWSKLQGLKPVSFAWCLVYLIFAYYVSRWTRGLLPIAAAMAIVLLVLALIAGTGVSGTSWFDRNSAGFTGAQSMFGGAGLSSDAIGLTTLLIAPVQMLLILFSMYGFSQGWNVEVEVPVDEASRRGGARTKRPPAKPAAA